jgi:hypothetical protein
MDLKTALIHRLDEARAGLESVLPRVDPAKQIYPNWTLKQMLDHIAGWDDAVIASLNSHVGGRRADTPADRGINIYNAQTVSTRESISFDQSLHEFQASRQILKKAIQAMPEEKLTEPLVTPWGDRGTVSEIVEIFAGHEDEHTADILRWLENPDKPITGH